MRLLTLLPAAAVERITEALGTATPIEAVVQPDQFLELAKSGLWTMLIVDPDLIAQRDAPAFVDLVGRCPAPVIVYSSLTRATARTIALLARRSLSAVLLRGFDDSLPSIRTMLDPSPVDPLGASVVELLASELDDLPSPVRRGTIAAFCASAPVNSPTALAALSGQTRRSIDRSFARVGLKPAKPVLATSQLIRAYSFLADPSRSLTSVAMISGFGSAKALSHNSLALTGIPARALRETVLPSALISHLVGEVRSTKGGSRRGL